MLVPGALILTAHSHVDTVTSSLLTSLEVQHICCHIYIYSLKALKMCAINANYKLSFDAVGFIF